MKFQELYEKFIAEAKINDKDYKFYVIIDDKIESGWEYNEDAKEHVKENLKDLLEKNKKTAKIYSLVSLKRMNLDPEKNDSWHKNNWWK